MKRTDRTEMYALLAEAFAEPVDWICLPGTDWPLYDLAKKAYPADRITGLMAGIHAETLDERRIRYASLFGNQLDQSTNIISSGKPEFWLYESAFLTGKILTSSTFDVAKLYQKFGLEVSGSDLPDGISQELAFLSYLSVDYAEGEIEFLSKHASSWLPALGLSLSKSVDPVYSVIGLLLYQFLTEQRNPESIDLLPEPLIEYKKPALAKIEECTLCGFCAQLCSRHALNMKETDSHTNLVLNSAMCNSCGRCVRVCDRKLLELIPDDAPDPGNIETDYSALRILHSSERVHCKRCGEPMVSRAELDYVISQIGHPEWLNLCQNCRVPAYQ